VNMLDLGGEKTPKMGRKKQGQRGAHQAGERPVDTGQIPGDRQYSLHHIRRPGQETEADMMMVENE
jgi:hypothetical protein